MFRRPHPLQPASFASLPASLAWVQDHVAGVQSMKIPDVRIQTVTPVLTGMLRISWDDGVTRDVDVSAWMRRHPLLEMLNDPDVFRDVSVVNNGGGVEWVNGADFCAQALRMLSDEQAEPKARITA